jgi:hypothetical protein
MSHANYTVDDIEQFSSKDYSGVVEEISKICEATMQMPNIFKADILISFTKTHSLKTSLLHDNPRFGEAITGSFFPVKHIESLFEASSKNSVFTTQFEAYLRSQFKA